MVSPLVLPPLKPVLDILFGFGSIAIFGDIMLVIYHSVTYRFTPVRMVELIVLGFLFAICLDWVAGFNFFENTVAPLVWSILEKTS
jgi:hypothetical protein